MGEPLEEVFAALRDVMLRSSSGMLASGDEPRALTMTTSWNEPGKEEPAWFGAVQLQALCWQSR